ncbi:MAG: hypothetical protein WB952_01995 [Terriglobales bacterium]
MKRGAGGKATEVGPQTANAHVMPVLDEGTFQQILEAAYVLQEQNAAQRVVRGRPDATTTLAEIAETQQLLRSQLYDLPTAASLIAERLQKITHATAVIIALIHDHQLEYCAATGNASALVGSRAPIDPNLAQFLQEGDVLRRFQVNTQLSAELLQKQGAKSPAFFPIYHDAKIAGVLQLSFPEASPIQEPEIRSCQVMAGLMGEVIGRSAEVEWKQALAAERATMMEALEQLRPQLERLAMEMPKAIEQAAAEVSPAASLPEPVSTPPPELIPSLSGSVTAPTGSATCGQCGYQFGNGELFCGRCGTPRAMNVSASGDLPSDWDALWQSLQQPEREGDSAGEVQSALVEPTPQPAPEGILPADLEAAIVELAKEMSPRHEAIPSLPFGEPGVPMESVTQQSAKLQIVEPRKEPAAAPIEDLQERGAVMPEEKGLEIIHSEIVEPENFELSTTAPEIAEQQVRPSLVESHVEPVAPEFSHPEFDETLEEKPQLQLVKGAETAKPPSPWGSAARARKWLDSLEEANSPARIWLSRHRADLWVGLSVILLLLALSGWGSRSASYPAQSKTPPQPSLSLFEKMLVGLGLAEAPPAPVYLGNPNVRVWVDLHTALYYCPGSELYGKTSGGKFTTQRDAQMDQFEPAARKNCE